MKNDSGTAAQKRRAGESAAAEVTDGMVVGLGTGSTAAHAIEELGRAVDAGLDIRGVPTSFQSRQLAVEAGIPLVSLDEVEDTGVDLAIDGADQFDAAGHLMKGGGAAHAREKIVDASADRFLVVADPSKESDPLDYPVPLEVLPDARTLAAERVRDLGGDPDLRAAERKDGPVVTDNGNLVLDCDFGAVEHPEALAADLADIPGCVAHGLFVGMADEIHVGTATGVEVR
ncbi:ribose-5-phosphate isomerase RpiA [Halospeciosus flavus]|uniref:Ribose-5-phosphate isomerase A n=1 Tax=Halospeciosus flavus TaxID=3032283 RepID=A0ABD5Z7E9_9EURY|nr:ribose-5-phosphate isomerase RpiA [Halospeciosus flavus]